MLVIYFGECTYSSFSPSPPRVQLREHLEFTELILIDKKH